EPRTVLADELTRRQAESLFDWGAAVELTIKGKAEPVQASRAERALPEARRARGVAGAEARLVGRERELATGREALDRTLAGSGGVLFVTGEAGIGKSRLLVELRRLFEGSETEAAEAPLW